MYGPANHALEPGRPAPVWKQLALPQAPHLAAVKGPCDSQRRAAREQRGRQPRRIPRVVQATVSAPLPLQAGGLDALAQVALRPASRQPPLMVMTACSYTADMIHRRHVQSIEGPAAGRANSESTKGLLTAQMRW